MKITRLVSITEENFPKTPSLKLQFDIKISQIMMLSFSEDLSQKILLKLRFL